MLVVSKLLLDFEEKGLCDLSGSSGWFVLNAEIECCLTSPDLPCCFIMLVVEETLVVGGGGGISSAEVISSFFVFASSPPRSCLLQAEVEGVVGEGLVDGAILQLSIVTNLNSIYFVGTTLQSKMKAKLSKQRF